MANLLIADLHNTILGGANIARQGYSPYGASRKNARAGLAFHGHPREAWSDNYLLGNGKRMYSPGLARFAMPDKQSPFGRGGCNAYAYCLADPVNRADPGGEISFFAVAKNIVWLAARTKAVLGGVTGLKRVGEMAKWGGRVGGTLTMLGVPGGATVASVSGGIALSVKAVTITRGLWKYVKPFAVRRLGSSASSATDFAGSLGGVVTVPWMDKDFISASIRSLWRAEEHINQSRQLVGRQVLRPMH
jgi:RHS repeat-associated protein